MEIPALLQAEILAGNVVLMLGAGASLSAVNPDGDHPPAADGLAKLLADRFLGGELGNRPLNRVSEYAINRANLYDVQDFIATIFATLEPSAAHRRLCSFRWRGIATTNYDRLIERSYETSTTRLQEPAVFIENGDRIDDRLRNPDAVPVLKLHGCITKTHDKKCPLILTTDQYILYRQGRSRLFDHFKDWCIERTVVFVGYGLQDADLRQILMEIDALDLSRPRYYLVTPDVHPYDVSVYEEKKISILKGTFSDFMTALSAASHSPFRGLKRTTPPGSFAISERFARHVTSLSEACDSFLSLDVDYVKRVVCTEHLQPRAFYKGESAIWSAIEQNLDVQRGLASTVIYDYIIAPPEDATAPRFVLIKAHAGAGKSVLLQRIAWDAAHSYDSLCLYVRPAGAIDSAAIAEIIEICDERVFLFVDDAQARVRDLERLIQGIGTSGRRLTIIAAARANEWNVSGAALSPFITEEYPLRYLTENEIDQLLMLLERHNALDKLKEKTEVERRAALVERAGRQLLVALHEATHAKPFVEIIRSEYDNIKPHDAQRMYLSICVLNRLGVPVRAGIIARLHGIHFEEFKRRLFAPLEHVVKSKYDEASRDYIYTARHPHIAEIVFEEILRDPEDRFGEYLKCIQQLNIDYSADRQAYNQMIRGRDLLDLFPDEEMVRALYASVASRVGDDPHLFHQMALYEIHRKNGDLAAAGAHLSKAQTLAPRNRSILHSAATLALKLSDAARTTLERDKHLDNAEKICLEIKAGATDSYPFYTLVGIALVRLKNAAKDSHVTDGALEDLAKVCEDAIADGLRRFPDNPHLRLKEAEFATFLADTARAFTALEKSFASNPRASAVGIRLARIYEQRGDITGAIGVYKRGLEAKSSDRKMHYAYARFLVLNNLATAEELEYHCRRAYSPGDDNLDAQLLHTRQLFLTEQNQELRAIVKSLSEARIGSDEKDVIHYPLPNAFVGKVHRLEAVYVLVAIDGRGDLVLAHRSSVVPQAWCNLSFGCRVAFRIGFSMRGPRAFEVSLEA
jgi:tetratricopeptide (TPR) repeat protein